MATTRRAPVLAHGVWRLRRKGGIVLFRRAQSRIPTVARWLSLTLLAVALALAATTVLLRPPAAHVGQLALDLALAGAAGLVLGEVALRAASTTRIGSVRAKLAIPPLLTALVIAFTVIALAQAMFISAEDSVLLLVFLGFAMVVALVLAGSLAGEIAQTIGRVETGARRIAEGDYAFRVPDRDTSGSDEIARLARWFNLMATNVEQAFITRERAEADRRQMLAALSHDLRTPLTSIRAMIESIDDGVTTDTPTVRRYQRAIRMEAQRLGMLLDDLFELSRLESGGLLLARERLGIDDLVSEALEAFGEQAERRNVQLLGQVDTDVPSVEIDPRQIARVLANLLQNALRYTSAGGVTLVLVKMARGASRPSDGALIVQVVDTGSGISADDLGRIFEPTYRGNAARDRIGRGADHLDEGTGAGLGLAIARAIVELHGGRIWAESPLPSELRAHLLPAITDPGMPFPGTALCFTIPLSC